MAGIDVSKYVHSPVHKAIVLKDYENLRQILASLPRFVKASEIHTEAASIAEEEKAAAISAVVDRRDVPNRDTPLHLAAKLGDGTATEMLMVAGANKTLKNKQGWSALREAIYNKEEKVAMIILRHSLLHFDHKCLRRLPRYIGALRRMRNFYMEISFHFESSVIPFISRIAPSDTYKIWKRGGNMRADMTLAGFDGLRIKREDMSILFIGDTLDDGKKIFGSFCFVSHKSKEVTALAWRDQDSKPPTDEKIKQTLNKKSKETLHRFWLDMTQAHLEPQLTWRGKERKEMVGPWKAKVYDIQNVFLSHTSITPHGAAAIDAKSASKEKEKTNKEIDELLTEEERKQLELALANKIDASESNNEDENGHKSGKYKGKKGHFGWHREKEHRKRKDSEMSNSSDYQKDGTSKTTFKPILWLSPDFPLKLEELIPILDILAEKVKAIRRLRDILTTEFPKETFPVKVSLPVVPTVRVVITFTKFEELQAVDDEFSSAPSSPTSAYQENTEVTHSSSPSSSIAADSNKKIEDTQDPFAIPPSYTWA